VHQLHQTELLSKFTLFIFIKVIILLERDVGAPSARGGGPRHVPTVSNG
jgi:hypothetical protein